MQHLIWQSNLTDRSGCQSYKKFYGTIIDFWKSHPGIILTNNFWLLKPAHMKRQLPSFSFLIAVILFFSSCQKEYEDVTPRTPVCKNCSYVPLCVGIKYTYYDTLYGNPTITSKDLLSSVDTLIDSKTYQKITTNGGVSYNNCTNGESTIIGYQGSGSSIQRIKLTMLKANAPVGTTWADTVINSSGQTIVYDFKIEAKNISRVISSFYFIDVIIVSLKAGIMIPGVGLVPSSIYTYYYANGVGLVELSASSVSTGQVLYHTTVKTYVIP